MQLLAVKRDDMEQLLQRESELQALEVCFFSDLYLF